MEYIFKCSCGKRGILKTRKTIHKTTRLPQRQIKCFNCGLVKRVTIVGEVVKANPIPQENVNPEIALEVQPNNRLIFRYYK